MRTKFMYMYSKDQTNILTNHRLAKTIRDINES